MEYLTIRRLRGTCLGGQINLSAQTRCEARNGILYWQDVPLCFETSELAHRHFARNDDGQGLLRGQLIRFIFRRLAPGGKPHPARWALVQRDSIANRYRRPDAPARWLWSHEFYTAPIFDLRHIAALLERT